MTVIQAYEQEKYVPAGAWCEIIKEIEVSVIQTKPRSPDADPQLKIIPVDKSEAAAQPKPYAVAAGLVSLDNKIYIEGNFVLPTKVPKRKMQHYRVEYDENSRLHYVQEKKNAKDHIVYAVSGDLPTQQPANQQSPELGLKEQPTTDRVALETSSNKSRSAKQALKGRSKKPSKIFSPVLKEDRDTASSPFFGATKSKPEPLLNAGNKVDGDSPASISLAHTNETLHSRNTSSTMSTIFSIAGRSSRATTPPSPSAPIKGESQEFHTDVGSQADELSKLIESMPSAIPASFATPLGTITSDRPGSWLETREYHEQTIVDPVLEAITEKSAAQKSAEFLADVASSFLKKKTTGPFCWVEIGRNNYMTVWTYICGYLDYASHHGWKELKKDLCRPDKGSEGHNVSSCTTHGDTKATSLGNAESEEKSAEFQDAQADHTCENAQPDTGNEFASDLASDPAILSYGKVIGKIHRAASEEKQDPVVDSSIDLDQSLCSPTVTENKPERDHGLGQSSITQEHKVQEEPNTVDLQPIAIDTTAAFHQDVEKEEETLQSSCLPPESSTPYLNLETMLEGGHGLEHVFVGHPRTKQDNKVRKEEPTDMPLATDTVPTPHDEGANEDENISDLPSSEPAIPTASLRHMLEGGNGLQHVFVGHPWIVENNEVREEDPGDSNSNPVTGSTADFSNQEVEAKDLQTPDSRSVSTEPMMPFVSLEHLLEGGNGLQHVFVGHHTTKVPEDTKDEETSDFIDDHLLTATGSENLSEDTYNEEITVPVTSCILNQGELKNSEGTNFDDVVDAPLSITACSDNSCENTDSEEKSQPEGSFVSTAAEPDTPYCNLDYETTHGLSHVYPWLKPSQAAGDDDTSEAKRSHVPNDDDSSMLSEDLLKQELTEQPLSHVFVEHNQATHPEETDTGKLSGDENNHVSSVTGSDKPNEYSNNEEETETASSDMSSSQGLNIPYCDLQRDSGRDLSHIFVGQPRLTSRQDAQQEDEFEADSSCVSNENDGPVLDEGASNNEQARHPLPYDLEAHKLLASNDDEAIDSHGGEGVDPISGRDHEDVSALTEDDNSKSTANFNLKHNQVQQSDELKIAPIVQVEEVPLYQTREENNTIKNALPIVSTALTLYHRSPKVNGPILMVQQKPVIDVGTTGSQCQVDGAPLVLLEVDEIVASIYSVRQLFTIKRVTTSPIETRESYSNDTVEDSKGREVILRSLCLNNAAKMKMAQFVELTKIGMRRPNTDAISVGLSSRKLGVAVVHDVVAKENKGSVAVPQATEDLVKQAILREKANATGMPVQKYSNSCPKILAADSSPARSVLWLILGFTMVVLLW